MVKQKSAAIVSAAVETEAKEAAPAVSASEITEMNTPAANVGKSKGS